MRIYIYIYIFIYIHTHRNTHVLCKHLEPFGLSLVSRKWLGRKGVGQELAVICGISEVGVLNALFDSEHSGLGWVCSTDLWSLYMV